MRIGRARFGTSFAVVAVMAIVASGCHFNNWYQYRGYGDGTASNDDSHNLTTAQATSLTEQAKAKIGTVPSLDTNTLFQSGPVEFEGVIYVNGEDGSLHAYDENGLKSLWDAKTSGKTSLSNPPASVATTYPPGKPIDNVIIAPSTIDNTVYAFHLDGSLAWSTNLGGQGGTININSSALNEVGGGITLIGAGTRVFTLDSTTGNIDRRSTSFTGSVTTPVLGGFRPSGVGTGNLVWFGTGAGHVKALDDASLTQVWDWKNGSGNKIGAITTDGDNENLLFAGTNGGQVVALDGSTGIQRGVPMNNGISMPCACGQSGELAASGQVLFMTGTDLKVRSFLITTFNEIAETATAPGPSYLTVAGGVLYGTWPLRLMDAQFLTILSKPTFAGWAANSSAEAVPADGALWVVGTDGFIHELT
ncbi:MAG TPA: PQQ-binding-like beta-propeller repeat protein [Acidimicrobiia bacterium]|nr:PQQ-binding-like beta-propeller repeat protein [Acidimicrobiia bacterium]